MARDRVVVLTWDPQAEPFWLVRDYFPEIAGDTRTIFPTFDWIANVVGEVEIASLPIPAGCTDGFLGAYWRRPHAYLDAIVRAGISSFARATGDEPGFNRLRADLESGVWAERNASLLSLSELDIGYRLVVASGE